ncbi:hypothetical protein SNEBB_005078 [Seison nebaliae]|nr:hypothetical protein SNEBB_005078 [Seison nebaliae]
MLIIRLFSISIILGIIVCYKKVSRQIDPVEINLIIKGIRKNKENAEDEEYPEFNLCFPTILPPDWKEYYSNLVAEKGLREPAELFDPLAKLYETKSNITFSTFEYEIAEAFTMSITEILSSNTPNDIPYDYEGTKDDLIKEMRQKPNHYRIYFRKRFIIFFGLHIDWAMRPHYASFLVDLKNGYIILFDSIRKEIITYHISAKVIGQFLVEAATALGENNEQLIENNIEKWTIRTPNIAVQKDWNNMSFELLVDNSP